MAHDSETPQLASSTSPSIDSSQSIPSLDHLPTTSRPSPPNGPDQNHFDPPSIPALRMPTFAEFHAEYRALHEDRFGTSFHRFLHLTSPGNSSHAPAEYPARIPTILDVQTQIVSRRQEVNNRRNPNGLLDLAYFISSDRHTRDSPRTFRLLPADRLPCPIYPFVDPQPEVLRFNSEQRERIRKVNKAIKLGICDAIDLCAGGYTLIEVYEIAHDLLDGAVRLIQECAGPETAQMRNVRH